MNSTTSEAQEKSLLEELCEGSQKLYFIFGGIANGVGMPPFEFYKALGIVEENKVFVRDFDQAWYHHGLRGLSSDIEATKDLFLELIEKYQAKEVVMIGNSMGGYAALLFSNLIGSRAIAFSPQTFIGPFKGALRGEKRWIKARLKTWATSQSKPRFPDLSTLGDSEGWQADIHVSKTEKLDLKHARNMSNKRGVEIKEYDFGGHQLVKELRDKGLLSQIIAG